MPAIEISVTLVSNGRTFGATVIGTDSMGRDWKTAGYWAGLRASSPLAKDDGLNFLRLGEWFSDAPRARLRRTPFGTTPRCTRRLRSLGCTSGGNHARRFHKRRSDRIGRIGSRNPSPPGTRSDS